MKLKKWKRLCGLLLAAVLVGSSFLQYTGVAEVAEAADATASEETVPIFDATCHRQNMTGVVGGTYANGEVKVDVEASSYFSTDLSQDASYYMTMKLKSEGSINLNYRSTTGKYLLVERSGIQPIGNGEYIKDAAFNGLGNDGITLTIYSSPTALKVWVGDKMVLNGAYADQGDAKPGIQWSNKHEVTISNICIWTDGDGTVPVYDEKENVAHTMTPADGNVVGESFTVAAEGKKLFTGVPNDAPYYATMVVKGNKVSIGHRAGYYILLDAVTNSGKGQYYANGVSEAYWVDPTTEIFALMKSEGIRVTYYSTPNHLTVWVNGNLLFDGTYSPSGTAGTATKVTMGISYSWSTAVTVTDMRIWTEKEPIFDSKTDIPYEVTGVTSNSDTTTYNGTTVTIPASEKAEIVSALPVNADYYFTMKVKSTGGAVNIGARGGKYFMQIANGGCHFNTDDKTGWENNSLGLYQKLNGENGLRVTVYSTTTQVKIWFDGNLTYILKKEDSSSALPAITWAGKETTLSDIQIWIPSAAVLENCSITLDGKIGVNFYMNLGTINPEEAMMHFTLPDGSTQQVPGEFTKNGYKYTCEVAAKEMTKEIKGKIVAGDAVCKEYTYSVKKYADTILSDEATYEKEIPLVKAMLNYGAYAQTYFGCNTEALANAGLKDTDVSGVTAANLNDFAKEAQSNAIATLYGARLILESETTLKLYFTLPEGADVSTYRFSKGSEPLTPVKSGTYYYVAITNIDAKNLDTDCTVTVKCGDSTFDVTYSPMTYCYNVLTSYTGDKAEKLKNVVRALYLYNRAANDYFPAEAE